MGNSNYDELYLRILQIGKNHLNTGLNFNELKSELEKLGYDFKNDCIELAVAQWFQSSFHHFACDEPFNSAEDVLMHPKCNCIMKGESCMALLDHDNNVKNNKFAIIAIVLALLAIGYSVFHDYKGKKEQSTQQIELRPTIKGFQTAPNPNK